MIKLTADWLLNPATRAVCDALGQGGAQVFFVGGCVRNTLLNVDVSDIDIATDATPDVVAELSKAAGIKTVPTGLEHGTITLVQDGLPHEVTTFRRDVSTDGRRATVVFSRDVAEDAARRDFTMNAIYARPDGEVVDPLNGLPDLQVRRVRFIGNAEERIREDYLRSLRFFRFHAWYGDTEAGFDPDALAAIAANIDGLGQLSLERIGTEFLKLLSAPEPAPSVAAMRMAGALGCFLSGADDRALALLVHLEGLARVSPDPIRRLAVLGGSNVPESLRLSRARTKKLEHLHSAALATTGATELGYRLGVSDAQSALLLRCAFTEQSWRDEYTFDIERGAAAIFPVRAKDLMPDFQGPALGAELVRLEGVWIASDFRLTKDRLLLL